MNGLVFFFFSFLFNIQRHARTAFTRHIKSRFKTLDTTPLDSARLFASQGIAPPVGAERGVNPLQEQKHQSPKSLESVGGATSKRAATRERETLLEPAKTRVDRRFNTVWPVLYLNGYWSRWICRNIVRSVSTRFRNILLTLDTIYKRVTCARNFILIIKGKVRFIRLGELEEKQHLFSHAFLFLLFVLFVNMDAHTNPLVKGNNIC